MKSTNVTLQTGTKPSVTRRSSFLTRFLASFLVAVLIGGSGAAYVSAEDTVESIAFGAVSSNPVQLSVEDGTKSLTLWANFKETSTPQNVTSLATWASSSSLVKVDKGVLSATGAVSGVSITAKYKTFSASIIVDASYSLSELQLEVDGANAGVGRTVWLGDELTLTAVNADTSEDVSEDAVWTSSSASVATVENGEVTLVAAGTTKITAKYKGRSDSVTLTVKAPYSEISIVSPKIESGIVDLNVGDDPVQFSLSAVRTDDDSTESDLETKAAWTSSNSAVVKVDKNGLATAVGSGTATVTATLNGVKDAVTFYVLTPYEAMKLASEKPLNLSFNAEPVKVTASVVKGSAQAEDKTAQAEWKSGNLLVASVGTDAAGVVTVKPRGVGTTQITASYLGVSKSLTVTVFPTIESVDVVPDKLDAFEGDTVELPQVNGVAVSGDPVDLTKLVQWKSGSETVLTVDETGKWKALKAGTATLLALVENEEGQVKTDQIEVTVHKKIHSLYADTTNISIVTGTEAAFPAVTVIYADGEEKVITSEVTWKSSSTNLLVKATKIKGLQPATATLTGTYLGKTVSIKTVVEEKFQTIKVEPSSLALGLKASQTIKVTATTVSGKKVSIGSRITWIPSSEELISIKGASVKGLAEGSGKLTATIQGKALEIPFTVAAKLTKLTASPTSLKLTSGASGTVKVTATYENGKTVDVTSAVSWSNSNGNVAKVTGGTVLAIAKGSATLKGSFGGKNVTVRVTVKKG
ncbi:Ig domain-containing protein [Cohnella faecalis]|uniref:BIG2 domain-containing protein n=1 Tax=Cohnella faecalis TaxID=2315694 RepID=A0A398CN92_9BACL|nr:Ig-like domain-containing protein [Cohnella faecalis]RIE03772.1 hypothetical protein D3H35_09470 [Cohnella faecalis]